MPASGNKHQEILLIYGHHSSLERMFTFAEVLSRYGYVTMPDLPGFGGMEPFYKLNELPTLDNYSDYLAAFIKLRYKRKKAVIIGMSFAVPVIVKMLQKYPELEKRVEYIVSIAGFVHKEDFALPKSYRVGLNIMATIGSKKIPSFLLKNLLFQPFIIKSTYKLVGNKHDKLKSAGSDERNKRINFELELWAINDLRTYMYSLGEMLKVDVCSQRINVPIHHASPKNDYYFNDNIVEQHMRIIFDQFTKYEIPLDAHVPSIISSVEEVEPYIPKKLTALLEGNK